MNFEGFSRLGTRSLCIVFSSALSKTSIIDGRTATVVIELETTEVIVLPMATAIASLLSPGCFSFSSL